MQDDKKHKLRAHVLSVSKSERHGFSKQNADQITLLKGKGVEGDAHLGERVQHLYRMRLDPTLPNLWSGSPLAF